MKRCPEVLWLSKLRNLLWNVTGSGNSECKGIWHTLGREENLPVTGHVAAKKTQAAGCVKKEMEMLRAAKSVILPVAGT